MKKVEAITSAEGFMSLIYVLEDLGCTEITVTNIYARERKPAVQVWRGMRFYPELTQAMKLEVLVDDDLLDFALGLIRQHSSAGAAGNRRIAVFTLEEQFSDPYSERVISAQQDSPEDAQS